MVITDFSGGLNTAAADGALAENESRRLLNLRVDEPGRLIYLGGRHQILAPQDKLIRTFTRFANERDPSTPIRRLVFVKGDGGGAYSSLHALDESTGTVSSLGFTTISSFLPPFFATMDDRVFLGSYNAEMRVWDGSGSSRVAGMAAPGAAYAPIAADAGAGLLDSSAGTAYVFKYTFYSAARKTESNASPPSTPIDLVDSKAQVTNFDVTYASQGADRIRVYLQGGLLGGFYLVDEFTPELDGTGHVQDAAIHAPYVYNQADRFVSLIPLSEANLPPPVGIRVLFRHRNRLFGAGRILDRADITKTVGTEARLWYSRPGMPESWGEDDNGVDDDGGWVDIDNDPTNPILALSSTGSLLIIGRRKSVEALYGSTPTDFRAPSQRSNIGVASGYCLSRCDNVVCYLGADRRVHEVRDADTPDISLPIHPSLKDLTESQLASAVATYHEQKYILCIPNVGGTPVSYAYDFRKEAWIDTAEAALFNALFLASQPPATGALEDLLVASSAGGIYAAHTSDAVSGAIDWEREIKAEDGALLQASSVRLEGTITPDGTTPPVMTITAGAISRNFSLVASSGILLDIEPQADLVAEKVVFRLHGKISAGEITRIEIGAVSRGRTVR